MFLTYIDESGKPSPNDDEKEYVISSITIHETEYNKAHTLLNNVKSKYFPNTKPDDIEIHTTDIISGKGKYKGIDVSTRVSILKDTLNILNELDCTINCILIRKNLLPNLSAEEIDKLSFKLLFERLCYTHKELNHHLRIKNKDYPQFGLLFMDSINTKVDNQLKENIRALMKIGTEYTKNEYIIEDMIFVDSRYGSLSQIIDAVAYCVRRYYRLFFKSNSNQQELETYADMYKIISKRIRSYTNGYTEGIGIKIYPKR